MEKYNSLRWFVYSMPEERVNINLTLNNEQREFDVPSRYLLSDLLRWEANDKTVKRGCETGKCGACTVLLQDKPVKSCSVLAAQAEGKSVRTQKSLDDEIGMEMKSAFARNHALQCGFCTPGILMSTQHLLEEQHEVPDEDTIRMALQGNICRCTGYTRILEAIQDTALRLKE